MHFLLDHLVAVMVGATVLLMVAAVQFRGQEAAVDSVQYRAAKARTIDWARQVTQDLQNIGSGLTRSELQSGTAFIDTSFATNGVFIFRATTGNKDAAGFSQFGPGTANVICYERQMTGDTVNVFNPATGARTDRETFRIVRRLNPSYGAGSCSGGTVTGQSMDTLTRFDLRFWTQAGRAGPPPARLRDIRVLHIDLRSVSPLGGGTTEGRGGMKQFVDETRWSQGFRPFNLNRID
ncbi:MAG: hypothetical protein GVY35_18685 [Bacteroidetes bacterium]|jgi:hypothetical protein|nr:hypothetical protein [Bacteroidota bacterium]